MTKIGINDEDIYNQIKNQNVNSIKGIMLNNNKSPGTYQRQKKSERQNKQAYINTDLFVP